MVEQSVPADSVSALRESALAAAGVRGIFTNLIDGNSVGARNTLDVPRTDPLVQVDYVRVVDLDIGASKSDIWAIRVVTISERAGRTRACDRGLV
jgi:hypothetical protein